MGVKRAPGPILVGLKMFRRWSKEKVSSGVTNMAQACTLPARRTSPTSISNKDESHGPV